MRSGKTAALSLGFALWAMSSFDRREFAICGKSREIARRNVGIGLIGELRRLGFAVDEKIGEDCFVVRYGRRRNVFRYFGGMNEGSAALVQGLTLAGVLFDEAALLPESFVNQCLARLSVKGAKAWFSLNPGAPNHWFKRGFVDRAAERNYLYLHFVMEDNPSLEPEVIERLRRSYSGSFYRQFVLGLWEAPEGLVYDFMADGARACARPPEPMERYMISADYGTANPTSFGLWGLRESVWYRIDEFYHDGRKSGMLTDGEYVEKLRELAGERRIAAVIVDPSARSFIVALRRAGFRVRAAINSVADGIRVTAGLLKSGAIKICACCAECWREFAVYSWADGAGERVRKRDDHAMDEVRYFAMAVSTGSGAERR